MKLKFKKLDPRAVIPTYAHDGDSGMDVRALDDGIVFSRDRLAVRTGIAAVIPDGYELQVRPRSGLQFKHGVDGAFGTVDSNYTGEIGILLINTSPLPFAFKAGDRVAQLVLAPVARAEIEETTDEIADERRGDAGFGSTGVK